MKAYWYDASSPSEVNTESITSLEGASTLVAGLAGLIALLMSF